MSNTVNPSTATAVESDGQSTTARRRDRAGLWHWIALVLRLGLAGVFLFAGVPKLGHLETSQMATRAYQIFPYQVADVIGIVQPVIEIAIGVLLLLGLFTRVVAALSALLLVVFIAGIASAWARGLSIDCGCFSKGGAVAAAQTEYPWEIARDVLFLLIAGLLVWRPTSRFSLDHALWRD